MDFTIEGPLQNQSSVCVFILRELPEWFGIEQAIRDYEREIETLPTFLARSGGNVMGFLSLKQHNPFSAEIYVMGVRCEAQRGGIGQALVEAAESHSRELGVEYMQVKTLGPSRPDKGYAGTRAFYAAMGFCPLEEFPQIWGEHNPCLILVKSLSI
jgi:N-acetylglutamate synthase-like GNAT family acetyltransferase